MPFTRRRTYRRKRTGFRKKSYRRRNAPSTSIIRYPSAFSDRQVVKLRYMETVDLTGTTGAVGTQLYRGSSLYAPRYTAGHQPMGFDELSALYRKYLVYGCKCKVTFNSTSNNLMQVSLSAKSIDSTSLSVSTIAERGYAKTAYIFGGSNNAHGQKTLKMYQSSKRMAGVKKITAADGEFTAATNASPSNNWYFHLAIGDPNTSDTVTATCIVELKYYALMYDRILLGQS